MNMYVDENLDEIYVDLCMQMECVDELYVDSYMQMKGVDEMYSDSCMQIKRCFDTHIFGNVVYSRTDWTSGLPKRELGDLMCDMTHAEYAYTLQHTKASL